MKWGCYFCRSVLLNLTQAGVTGKREPQLGNGLPRPGLRACLWIMLGNDLSGRTQPTVSGASPGQVMLGCRRKQAGQQQASKQHVAPPWPLLQLLLGVVVAHSSWGPTQASLKMACKVLTELNPPSTSCFWVFTTAAGNKTEQQGLSSFI